MENDRAETNLGADADAEIGATTIEKPKQPKKRFVGRRAAEQAEKQSSSNGTIENSGAIQGQGRLCNLIKHNADHSFSHSRSTEKASTDSESCSSRNLRR